MEDDVRALWNHNDDMPLGRTRSETLFLMDGPTGLNVRILPPETSWGRDAITSMQRGDVDQMSFAFTVAPGGDEWRRDDQGQIIRVLKRGGCERLYDVSPVTYPAYPQTSAQVRSAAEKFAGSQAATVKAMKGRRRRFAARSGSASWKSSRDELSGENSEDVIQRNWRTVLFVVLMAIGLYLIELRSLIDIPDRIVTRRELHTGGGIG